MVREFLLLCRKGKNNYKLVGENSGTHKCHRMILALSHLPNLVCTIYRHSLFEFGFADRADIVSDYDNRGLVHKQDSNIIVVIFFIILIVEGIHFIDFLLGELYGKVCMFLATVGDRAEWINTEASFGLFLRSVKYLA